MTTTLVLGGARSGKSAYAERLLAGVPATYVATARPRPDDAAWRARVDQHRVRRPAHWTTVETTDVASVVRDATGPVLVDCLTLWLAAVLDDAKAWDDQDESGIDHQVEAATAQLVTALTHASVPVVVVSNEVGSGIVPATSSGREFRDRLGWLNQRVAASSDRVVLCVAGRTLELPSTPYAGDAAPDRTPQPAATRARRVASLQRVASPDTGSGHAAQQLVDGLAKPRGSLGRLEELAVWLAGVQGACPPSAPRHPAVVVFAGDHGIAADVSAYPPQVTAAMVAAVATGRAGVNALASAEHAAVEVVDVAVDADSAALPGVPARVGRHKVRRSSGRIDVEDALLPAEARRAYDAGCAIADEHIDGGADLLIAGDLGIGNTTPAAAMVAALTALPAGRVTGRGTGIDDATLARKTAAVAAAADRYRVRHLTDAQPPDEGEGAALALLATVGGADLAAMAGFLARAARRRVPVVLDGLVVTAAALAAEVAAPGARAWWCAAHRSPEPGHPVALAHLGLDPLLDLQLRLGEGSAAVAALPLLRSAAAMTTGMAALADLDPGAEAGGQTTGPADLP